jgi:hypothetical protein
MSYYVTWQTQSKIPLQERIGPFLMREMAVREVDFVLTDPRIRVTDIDIETVQGE